jgi:oligopeptidase B
MNRRLPLLFFLSLAACGPATPPSPPPAPSATAPVKEAPSAAGAPLPAGLAPPVAPKDPHTTSLHGLQLVDDYFWLRKKGSPEVLSYLAAENAYTDAIMKPTAPLQEALYKEMLARIKETDLSAPVRRGDWLYYTRMEEGKQYPVHCRKKAKEASPEIVLLDLNEIGKTEKFVGLGAFEASDDGNELAYALDTTGFRQYTLTVKDLRTNKVLLDGVPRVDSVAWARDDKTLLYVTEDATTKRPNQLHRRVLGDSVGQDTVVYHEKDEKFDLEVERSRSKEWIFVTSESKTTTEVRLIPAAKPTAEPTVLAPREQGHEYYVDHGGALFYIRTNSGGRNFRLVTAKASDPARAGWKEIVPHRDDVMLEGVSVFKDHYVLREREDGLPRLRVVDLKTGRSERIEMPEPVYALVREPNPEFSSKSFRYNYQSFVTPPSIFEYDIAAHEKRLLKRTEVPGGYDPTRYEMIRAHAPARDGTKIPLSLVYRKGTKPDGSHAMLLQAYGSYGSSLSPLFSSDRFSLLDRDVIFAIAHICGGGEFGKAWHDQGRMMAKMNTFTDFIDSAEHLVKEGYCAKDELAIQGRSAGGLLMGAVVNMRPDLFRVVMTSVPFVDVINTMLDESLPLTTGEFEEWGNPKVKEQYDYMSRYSPYDNIAAKAYPTMLVRTSYNDSQVMYWEPAKYVAKLRATRTDQHLLLMKTDMDPAGHGGKAGRYDRLRETAFDYAFLLAQLGLVR